MTTWVEGIKRGSISSTGAIERNGIKRTYQAVYIVRSNTLADREPTIRNTFGVPQYGTPWFGGNDVDPGARVTEINPREVADYLWEVDVTWTTTADEADEQNEAPEDRTPTWSWSLETKEERLEEDFSATPKPCRNSAEERLPIVHQVPIPVLRIQRYKKTFSPTEILDYVGKTNQNAFWGADPKVALMSGIEDREVKLDGLKYRQVTYTIKFAMATKLGTWDMKVLDQGTRYANPSNPPGGWLPFEDDAGNPTTGNLDTSGNAIAKGAAAQYLEFQVHEQADFDQLDLGPW